VSASLELQRAILTSLEQSAALAELIGQRSIHDHVPPSARFPFVTFGQTSAFDWSTSTETGTEHFVSLHVWSKTRGRTEVLAIMNAIDEALDGAPPLLAGHSLVSLTRDAVEARFDDNLAGYHGTVRFRIVTEPTP
jgi:hypothetical protein